MDTSVPGKDVVLDFSALHDYLARGSAELPPEHLYQLDERGEAVEATDLLEWARWMESDERRVVRQQRWQYADHTLFVSTVFLGINHRFIPGTGAPILWETMAWSDDDERVQRRYTSRPRAIRGHRAVVRALGGADLG